MSAPTTWQAISMGARATGRASWLVAPGLVMAFLRAALSWPVPVFAVLVVRSSVGARMGQGLGPPGALVTAALHALTAPRTLAILAGLWLAGWLFSGALRVAWLAGALPTLGHALSGDAAADGPFAEGLAFGFVPLLVTALLGAALELAAQLYAWSVFLATALLAYHGGGGHPILAALLGAMAVTTAVAAPILAALVADAALARTALSGDGPAHALAEGGRRVLARPGAFLVSAIVLSIVAALVIGVADGMQAAALGLVSGAPPLLVIGPRLVATTLSAGVAALLDLWRLGTVAALACADET